MIRVAWAMFLLWAISAAPLAAAGPRDYTLEIATKTSLCHLGPSQIEKNDEAATGAAILVTALEKNDPAAAAKAREIFEKFRKQDAFGREYLALQWFCDLVGANEAKKQSMVSNPVTEAYFRFFSHDNYAFLREYLSRQFGLIKPQDEDPEKAMEHVHFMEDLLIYNSPRRTEWEDSSRVLELINPKPGEKIADIGSGAGYYTYPLSQRVGPKGHVYAIDIQQEATDYMERFVLEAKLSNITPIKSERDDIKLAEKVDKAFIGTLYHLTYITGTEQFRKAFVESIKKALKPGGTLTIVDNAPMPGSELEGNSVAKELLIAHFQHMGFVCTGDTQLTPIKYVLTFKLDPSAPITYKQARFDAPVHAGVNPTQTTESHTITIGLADALIHIGSLDSFDITPGGIEAARFTLSALEKKNADNARSAIDLYSRLIPNENFGGEYSALKWFNQHFIASPEEKAKMLENKLVDAYFHFFADNDYAVLKEYVSSKYKFQNTQKEDPEVGHTRRAFLEDFILFNNPHRESWEETQKFLDLLPLKKGDKIMDIGSGPGYYTYKFSQMVGDTGKVYALDVKPEHLEFLNKFLQKNGIRNVDAVESKYNDVVVRPNADVAFMCSLYHIIYAVSPEKERSEFVESIKQALRPGGKLVIVDNGPVSNSELPYHGPNISHELIIAQMEQYGFVFDQFKQVIPQRYLLVFTRP